MKSKAVVFTSRNTVEVREISCPEPGPDDVVIDVHHSWISNGTEGSFLRGERVEGDVAWRPGDPNPFPLVPGYQKTGRILAIGEQVRNFQVGQTVFAIMGKVEGMFSHHGGHVSPSVSPQSHVLALPEGADPVAYSGLVLTQVGYNCGTRPPVTSGDLAVVVGDGMVGIWAAQALVSNGAKVLFVGKHQERLRHLEGKAELIRIDSGYGVAEVSAWRQGRPIDILVDTVGSKDLLFAFLSSMRRGGHIVSAGFYGTEDTIPLQHFRNQEISFDLVSGSVPHRLAATRDWLAAGKIETLPLITHRFPVEQAPEAWDLIRSRRDGVLGVVLDWK